MVSARAARTSEAAAACIPRYTGSRRYTADRDATAVHVTWQRRSAGGEATALAGGGRTRSCYHLPSVLFVIFVFVSARARPTLRHSRSKSHRRPHVHDTVNNTHTHTHTLDVNKPASTDAGVPWTSVWSPLFCATVSVDITSRSAAGGIARPANTVNVSRPLALRPVGIENV